MRLNGWKVWKVWNYFNAFGKLTQLSQFGRNNHHWSQLVCKLLTHGMKLIFQLQVYNISKIELSYICTNFCSWNLFRIAWKTLQLYSGHLILGWKAKILLSWMAEWNGIRWDPLCLIQFGGKFRRIIEQSNSLAYWGPGDPLVIWHRHTWIRTDVGTNKHGG